ncbi:hypothetical protein KCV00_g69, partial [Aureobasidium melanogenum]
MFSHDRLHLLADVLEYLLGMLEIVILWYTRVKNAHSLVGESLRLVTKRNASVRMRVKRVSLLPALSYFALSNNTPRDLCMEGNRMIAIIPNPVLHGVPDKSKALKTMRKFIVLTLRLDLDVFGLLFDLAVTVPQLHLVVFLHQFRLQLLNSGRSSCGLFLKRLKGHVDGVVHVCDNSECGDNSGIESVDFASDHFLSIGCLPFVPDCIGLIEAVGSLVRSWSATGKTSNVFNLCFDDCFLDGGLDEGIDGLLSSGDTVDERVEKAVIENSKCVGKLWARHVAGKKRSLRLCIYRDREKTVTTRRIEHTTSNSRSRYTYNPQLVLPTRDVIIEQMASKDIFADYIVYLRVALAMLLFVRHSLSVAVSHGSANLLASVVSYKVTLKQLIAAVCSSLFVNVALPRRPSSVRSRPAAPASSSSRPA